MGITPTLNMLVVGDGTGSRQAWLGICDRSAVGLNTLNTVQGLMSQQLTNFQVQAGDLMWQGGENAIPTTIPGYGVTYGVKLPWELGIGSVDYPPVFQRYENYRKMSDDADPSRGATQLPSVLPSLASPDDYSQATLQPDTVYVTVSVPKYRRQICTMTTSTRATPIPCRRISTPTATAFSTRATSSWAGPLPTRRSIGHSG